MINPFGKLMIIFFRSSRRSSQRDNIFFQVFGNKHAGDSFARLQDLFFCGDWQGIGIEIALSFLIQFDD